MDNAYFSPLHSNTGPHPEFPTFAQTVLEQEREFYRQFPEAMWGNPTQWPAPETTIHLYYDHVPFSEESCYLSGAIASSQCHPWTKERLMVEAELAIPVEAVWYRIKTCVGT